MLEGIDPRQDHLLGKIDMELDDAVSVVMSCRVRRRVISVR